MIYAYDDPELQLTELWVPRGTEEAEVQAVCHQYIAQGRYPVIYRSGSQGLTGMTQELLANNLE